MWRTYFVVAVFTLLAGIAGASEPKPETIKQWIQQLDAEAFADREAASEAILKIGRNARAPIEAALMQPDISPELRIRGRDLLEKLKLQEIRENALQLSAILEQATLANRGKLDQAKLQAMLEQLVEVWSDVSGEAKSLPVTFKDVQAAAVGDPASRKNALVTLDCGYVISFEKCIVLADTAVDIASAKDCIIIAGTSVSVSSPQNCIILAGEHIQVGGGENNLILSGGRLTASIARKAVIGAARHVSLNIAENVVYLNSRVPDTGEAALRAEGRPERIPKEVQSEAIILELPERKNPLEGIITLNLVFSSRVSPLVVFQRKGKQGEYVARVEQEIRSPDGPPIPELEGWRLIYCGNSSFAVFRKGEESAVLRIAGAR